jgi:hypothetical protein
MSYKGPAHSWEGHPNHHVHAKLMRCLYEAEQLIEVIKHDPEDLGVAMHQIERIAYKFRGYARRLPLHMQKMEQMP